MSNRNLQSAYTALFGNRKESTPALLRSKEQVKAASDRYQRINNTDASVCPFCNSEMRVSSIRMDGGEILPVRVCLIDNYVAPIPDEE